ncbi:TetR family transcriptional regulator [Amycolatopsis sp. NPDC026612]|uniref:TetR family transcriptional regulator n=1 Tax=Amycolatopsis sp. NPDC026612 TaxID=3155466 RepID=UPI0033FE02BF
MASSGTRRVDGEGLRERKKRAMRRQLSDTAARMFVEHGFDAVRVADVAAACGVSEKTVFNYFPSKEALVLDRLEPLAEALRTRLADPALPPVAAMLKILDEERRALAATLTDARGADAALAGYRKFGDLIRENPSLRAYQNDLADRFVDVAAEALATRAGLRPADPEPQIAAVALLGLWRMHYRALRVRLQPGQSVEEALAAAAGDVRSAASLIESGLAAFPAHSGAVE